MYHLLHHTNNNKKDNSLIILPGFSSKSFYWTFGRMNKFIINFDNFKKYSDIIIFDFHEIKPLINKENFGEDPLKNFYKDKIDHIISEHVNHILNKLNFKNISLIARSAGGGIAIYLSSLHR